MSIYFVLDSFTQIHRIHTYIPKLLFTLSCLSLDPSSAVDI